LIAPGLIRAVVIDTFSARICGSRVCSASPSGASPACDTRLSSSKRAELAVNLCAAAAPRRRRGGRLEAAEIYETTITA
jgi:hypothetical protein